MKLAGVKDAGVQSLRDTFATSHLESDTDTKTVSEFLGHSSLDVATPNINTSGDAGKKSSSHRTL